MQLVAVLRKPSGLSALVSRRAPVGDLGALLDAGWDRAAGGSEIVELPLDDAPLSLCPQKTALLAAWDALRSVSAPAASVLDHALIVLQSTVRPQDDAPDLDPLALPDATAPIAPTAAHPRAYKGTKHRPPRPRAAVAADLRPHLCTLKGTKALLAWLADCRPDVVRDAEAAAEWEQGLPPAFRAALLPVVQAQGRAAVRAFLALHWRLELEADAATLAAVVRLCLRTPAHARSWMGLLAELPAARRALSVDLLLETGAYRVDADCLTENDRRLLTLAAQEATASRVYSLLCALVNGIPLEYLAAGFRLCGAQDKDFKFHEMDWAQMVRGAYFPEAAVTEAVHHWSAAADYYGCWLPHVWQQCGRLAGLGRTIEQVDWTRYPPDDAFHLLRFYLGFVSSDGSPDAVAEVWRIIEHRRPRLEALLHDTPADYRQKLLANLKDFCWAWEEPQALRRCLPALETLLRRLCRPPFRRECDLQSAGADFLEFLDDDQRGRFLQAPDAAFLRLEGACRRDNDAGLCGLGTWSLARHRPAFLLEAFLAHTAKLFKVCKLLGSFRHAQRDLIVREFALSEFSAPTPRLLREHREGVRRLPDAQLAHYEAQWRRQTLLTELEALEQRALASLSDGYEADPSVASVRHALQIQRDSEENRRALRRFLKAHWTGDDDYLLRHPRTQAWLARHPWLNVARWQEGIPYTADTSEFGPLTISVERDPLEALRLGTYVGSCLGLGGICAYSAAAAVLDINKQVLYARRPDGAVIARQLVAVSEEQQLVCFRVYPYSIGADLQQHFSAYNRLLSRALGLPVWRPGAEEDYTVRTIIAHGWWDDSAWGGKARKHPVPEGGRSV